MSETPPHPHDLNRDDNLRRIVALRAKADSTEYPAEAQALRDKADHLAALISTPRQHGRPPAEQPAPPDVVAEDCPALPDADAYLLGLAASEHGVRAVRLCRPDDHPRAAARATIRLIGRPDDLAAAKALLAELVAHRDAAVDESGLDEPDRRRFAAAYAFAVGTRLRAGRAADRRPVPGPAQVDEVVAATLRVRRPMRVSSDLIASPYARQRAAWQAGGAYAQDGPGTQPPIRSLLRGSHR